MQCCDELARILILLTHAIDYRPPPGPQPQWEGRCSSSTAGASSRPQAMGRCKQAACLHGLLACWPISP